MRINGPIGRAWVGLAVLSAVNGCVKRKEWIVVKPDGAIHWRIENEGGQEDMETGAPAMTHLPGWKFSSEVRRDDDDETVVRKAEITLQAGSSFPTTYPADDVAGAELAVQFTTTLTREPRADGVYYHFRRVYQPREWAFVNYWHEEMVQKPLERGGGGPVENMSQEKKEELVQNAVDYEALKHLAFARRAIDQIQPLMAQDSWLKIRETVLQVARSTDRELLMRLLEQGGDEGDSDPSGDRLVQFGRTLGESMTQAAREMLRELRFSPAYAQEFERLVKLEMRRYAITEDYGDEEWEVVVELPGTVVAHNGDPSEDGELRWTFDGRALFDRPVELLATCVLKPDDRH